MRRFVHTLYLRTKLEWEAWQKTSARPVDIPSNPPRAYKDAGEHSPCF